MRRKIFWRSWQWMRTGEQNLFRSWIIYIPITRQLQIYIQRSEQVQRRQRDHIHSWWRIYWKIYKIYIRQCKGRIYDSKYWDLYPERNTKGDWYESHRSGKQTAWKGRNSEREIAGSTKNGWQQQNRSLRMGISFICSRYRRGTCFEKEKKKLTFYVRADK